MNDRPVLPNPDCDPDVAALLTLHNLSEQLIWVEFEDHGYSPNFCHVSAKHATATKGGQRIHGWAIWRFPHLVLAEFHSVWQKSDGTIVDVTPPKDGGTKILFVSDPSLSIVDHGNIQALYTDRSSSAAFPYWFLGNPTIEQEWGIANDNPALVAYCASLKLSSTSMV